MDLLGALAPTATPVAIVVPSEPSGPPEGSVLVRTSTIIVDRPVLAGVASLAGAAAMGVSYSRNESIGWAFLHGLIGIPYLAYVLYDTQVKNR
jgi:hypothetical protein